MSKAVRESIDQVSWQANPKESTSDAGIIHDARDLIQTLQWQSSVDMDKPKNGSARSARTDIHLPATTAIALNKVITKSGSEPICAIGASAVCNDDLRSRRSLSQMLKEWSYQRRFVKNRDNDRDVCSNALLRSPKAFGVTRSCLCQSCTQVYGRGAGR
jgi:stage V sporulation protein SpoVS